MPPPPEDPESSREGLWAPAFQPRAQSSLASLGESWALVWGQSGTKVLEEGQDTQPGMAMPHNALAPAGILVPVTHKIMRDDKGLRLAPPTPINGNRQELSLHAKHRPGSTHCLIVSPATSNDR